VTGADVLVVADPDDPHASAVIDAVTAGGRVATRFNLTDMARSQLTSSSAQLRLSTPGLVWLIDSGTTVWWHRAGVFDSSGFDDEDERRLAEEESLAVLLGSLAGSGARWLDEPAAIERAEVKQWQLTAAAALRIRTPEWIVTNDAAEAVAFGSGRSVVAKASSAGFGIAPFVGEVDNAVLALAPSLPTLLQVRVNAGADLRVVTVGSEAWAWRREREPDVVDWRARDSAGRDFEPVEAEPVCGAALSLCAELGLRMSVQDWLETPDEPVMLEVNPQGRWAFLQGALDVVAPALAKELTSW
jgi:hypothetical protein